MSGPTRFDDWDEGRDVERALTSARDLFRDVASGTKRAVDNLELLELGIEVLWEGGPQNRLLASTTIRDMQRDFAAEIRGRGEAGSLAVYSEELLRLRIPPQVLLARDEHRNGRYQEALASCLAMLTWLRTVCEGDEEVLLLALGHRHAPIALAEATVSILGIFPAALRRAALPQPTRETLRTMVVTYARAFVDDRADVKTVIAYPRLSAMATQVFKLLVTDPRCGEQALVRAYYELAKRSRPQTARAQTTSPELDALFSAYCHDEDGARRNHREARARLERFPCPSRLREFDDDADGELALLRL